jgi:hypothetical protein
MEITKKFAIVIPEFAIEPDTPDCIMKVNGSKVYFSDGEINSPDENSPAIERDNGDKLWLREDFVGRKDKTLPSVILADGTQMWFGCGNLLLRPNGLPNVITPNGKYRCRSLDNGAGKSEGVTSYYCVHDEYYPAEISNTPYKTEITFGGMSIVIEYCTLWRYEGKIHRKDAPAVTTEDGELWFNRGELHRDGGPAITYQSNEFWFSYGKLSRHDGPAVTYNEEEYYFLVGKPMELSEFRRPRGLVSRG